MLFLFDIFYRRTQDFNDVKEAEEAVEAMDGFSHEGRKLTV